MLIAACKRQGGGHCVRLVRSPFVVDASVCVNTIPSIYTRPPFPLTSNPPPPSPPPPKHNQPPLVRKRRAATEDEDEAERRSFLARLAINLSFGLNVSLVAVKILALVLSGA